MRDTLLLLLLLLAPFRDHHGDLPTSPTALLHYIHEPPLRSSSFPSAAFVQYIHSLFYIVSNDFYFSNLQGIPTLHAPIHALNPSYSILYPSNGSVSYKLNTMLYLLRPESRD